jgi:MOSC domain-containing protein YiiM
VHRTAEQLAAGLDHIRQSPTEEGTLKLIVRRPDIDEREVLEEAQLDLAGGLVGDNWSVKVTKYGPPDPQAQLNVMNIRCATLVAGAPDRIPLAGDQLYVDFNLSEENVPAGTLLAIGDAVIEITEKPHKGCDKFAARFGADALRFVNIGAGKELNLRGRNARVVQPGTIRRGDTVKRVVTS